MKKQTDNTTLALKSRIKRNNPLYKALTKKVDDTPLLFESSTFLYNIATWIQININRRFTPKSNPLNERYPSSNAKFPFSVVSDEDKLVSPEITKIITSLLKKWNDTIDPPKNSTNQPISNDIDVSTLPEAVEIIKMGKDVLPQLINGVNNKNFDDAKKDRYFLLVTKIINDSPKDPQQDRISWINEKGIIWKKPKRKPYTEEEVIEFWKKDSPHRYLALKDILRHNFIYEEYKNQTQERLRKKDPTITLTAVNRHKAIDNGNLFQMILKQVDSTWDGFIEAKKKWREKLVKLLESNAETSYLVRDCRKKEPRHPNFLSVKNKEFCTISFDYAGLRYKDGKLHFPKQILPPVKIERKLRKMVDKVDDFKKVIKKITFYRKGDECYHSISYSIPKKNIDIIKNTAMAIDVGLNNLATCVFNTGIPSIIMGGRHLKSANEYFNKEANRKKQMLSKLESYQNKQKEIQLYNNSIKEENKHLPKDQQKPTKKLPKPPSCKGMGKIYGKRNNVMSDGLHKISKMIIDEAIINKTEYIVIGKNKGWKEKIPKLNKKTTTNKKAAKKHTNFIQVPMGTMEQAIKYKAENYGIKVVEVPESYTSVCSSLDNEKIGASVKYKGNRKSRGLFISNKNIKINADVNGAYNILRYAMQIDKIPTFDIIKNLDVIKH